MLFEALATRVKYHWWRHFCPFMLYCRWNWLGLMCFQIGHRLAWWQVGVLSLNILDPRLLNWNWILEVEKRRGRVLELDLKYARACLPRLKTCLLFALALLMNLWVHHLSRCSMLWILDISWVEVFNWKLHHFKGVVDVFMDRISVFHFQFQNKL